MSTPRVLVAGRPSDLSSSHTDGFAIRHRAMLRLIAGRHEVMLLGLRLPHDDARIDPEFDHFPYAEVALPPQASTRTARAVAAVRTLARSAPAPWELSIAQTAATTAPSVVVTLGPWLNTEYRILYNRYPSVYLFEEDLSRMAELASQSRQGRLFRRLEIGAHGRSRSQPQVVVAISDVEAPTARLRFPRSRTAVVPITLPTAEWPVATSASEGTEIIVAGVLAEERNSEGLVEVLEEVQRRGLGGTLRFRLISHSGLHPSLERFVSTDWVEHRADPGPIDEIYRTSKVALVPAKRVTGMKTTVLQAWTTGCPVVCFSGSAGAFGHEADDALLIGNRAGEIVEHLLRAMQDDQLRVALVAHGLDQVLKRFDPTVHAKRFLDLLASATQHYVGGPA